MKEDENMTSKEEENENNCGDQEEDLLYTHKPESRDSSIQWNSNFCRKTGR